MRDFSGGQGSPFQGFDGVGVGDIQFKRVIFDGSLFRDGGLPEFWGVDKRVLEDGAPARN